MKRLLASAVLALVMMAPAQASDHSATYKAWIDCPAHPKWQRATVTEILSRTAVRGFRLTQKETVLACP